MEKNLRIIELYDIYGELLTKRQKEIVEMSFNDDLSLGEIAEELSISRQSVRDSLLSSERLLTELEEKLCVAEKRKKLFAFTKSLSADEKTADIAKKVIEILED